MLTAFALTTFQVARAIVQYVYQPSTSVVLPTKFDDILYPKIRTCYMHWAYWVDWKKAFELNYTKPAILYALSFLSVIYSSERFTIPDARTNLTEQMKANNISTVSEFYKSIAKKFPLANPSNLYQIDDSLLFTEIELVYKKFWGTVLCYSTPNDVFANHMAEAEEHIFSFAVQDQSYSIFEQFVTKEEYSRTVALWLTYRANYLFSPEASLKDLSGVTLPLLFFLDGYSESSDQIMYDNDWYKLEVTVSAHRWKNTPDYRCDPDTKGISKNQTEIQLCQAAYQIDTCFCPYFDLMTLVDRDEQMKLCSHSINFLDNLTSSYLERGRDGYLKSLLKCETNEVARNDYDKCVDNVRRPCEVWSYSTMGTFYTFDKTIREIATKNITEIFVLFPIPDEILITIELDGQTWEDFAGNVGGVLGIWTGASVVSFIQMFYLCCCSSKEFSNSNIIDVAWRPKRSSTKAETVSKQNDCNSGRGSILSTLV